MKRWLVALYPRAWRRRYAQEFIALLEQQSLTVWDILDIVRHATQAQLSAALATNMEDHMKSAHLQTLLVLAIGVALVVRSVLHAETLVFGVSVVGMAGIVCLLLGLGLSYRQRTQPGHTG